MREAATGTTTAKMLLPLTQKILMITARTKLTFGWCKATWASEGYLGWRALASCVTRPNSETVLRTRSTLTERLLAVGIVKGEETPRRGTPVLACRVLMGK